MKYLLDVTLMLGNLLLLTLGLELMFFQPLGRTLTKLDRLVLYDLWGVTSYIFLKPVQFCQGITVPLLLSP